MDRAIKYEINKEYWSAVECYESYINHSNSKASLDSYINLSFLYWSYAFGLLAHDKSDITLDDHSITGGNRYNKILDLGLNIYPDSIELHFWKKYFQHIIFGNEFTEHDCKKLTEKYNKDESNVPYFFLSYFDKENYKDKIAQMIDDCIKNPTAKNLYIYSIIGSRI